MAMFQMGFVHAALIDFAEGRDGSSWDRERRLADSLIETSSRFDGLFEPEELPEPETSTPDEPPRGGGLLSGLADMFGRLAPAR